MRFALGKAAGHVSPAWRERPFRQAVILFIAHNEQSPGCAIDVANVEQGQMKESIRVLRTRAELARRIADQMNDGTARQELLQIADDLEAEAEKIKKGDGEPE